MHYYQFNIGDYKAHTSYLSPIEDLAYRRLLDEIYLHEKPLTNDLGLLSKIIGLPENKAEVETVLKMFFSDTEKGWSNNRAMKEIKLYKSKAKAARENGKKGGRPKKAKITQPVKSANPTLTQVEAKQETRNKKHKTINNKQLNNTLTLITRDWILPLDVIIQMSKDTMTTPEFIIDTALPKFNLHHDNKELTNPINLFEKWVINERNFKR